MLDPLITLTTDFGADSPYAAAMKGVIVRINPRARIIDLSHQLPPQDVVHGAFFLAEAVPYFPLETLHVAVIDPGVGTGRKLLYVEVAGRRLLAPDNGVWTMLGAGRAPERVHELTEPAYRRAEVSPTFHGRDILAPAAGHLSLGLDPGRLGPRVAQWVSLPLPCPVADGHEVHGEVLFVDHFGNLITNVRASTLPAEGPAEVVVEKAPVRRWVRTYGEASPGELVALISSGGFLEIAVAQGDASRRLGVRRGAAVRVVLRQGERTSSHE